MNWGDFIKGDTKMQTEVQFLKDEYVNRKGEKRQRPWRKNKRMSVLLSESYRRLEEQNKAVRVGECGSYLNFREMSDGTKKLHKASFCKSRLCPMCAWRRSRKIFGQASRIMDYMTEHYQYKYIFLTLTFRNMAGSELSKAIDKFMQSFNRLTKTAEFKKLSKGFFRALEVTKRIERNDFHPHMHVIIAVNKSYFDQGPKSGYLTHKRWMQLWRECADLDYDPWVYVETVRADGGAKVEGEITYKGAVAEVAKYAVKGTDVIFDVDNVTMGQDINGRDMKIPKNSKLYEDLKINLQKYTDEMVFIMDGALKGRRLISYGGKMREVHKILNLDDPTDGDLIHADDDGQLRDDLGYIIRTYRWNIEYMNYVMGAIVEEAQGEGS